MRKNGFTLVELLGVIIILSLLLIFTLPSIINSVRSSSKDTDELTLKLIYEAADLYVSNNSSKFPKKDGNQFVISLKDLVDEGLLDSPIKLSDSELDLTDTKSVQINYNNGFDYELKDSDDCKTVYSSGTIVYFNVESGEVCNESDYHEDNSKTGYNGYTNKDESNNEIEQLDTQNSCLKFYAFNDDGGNSLNLLLDHNTTAKVAWTENATTNTNSNGPIDVINQLKLDTNLWLGTMALDNYEYKGTAKTYTIDYSEYKARLITGSEIAQITGADKKLNWDAVLSQSPRYYFDTLLQSSSSACTDNYGKTECIYGWLYDRTNTSCTQYGCYNNSDVETNGYWTSSAYVATISHAWSVDYYGSLDIFYIDSSMNGVRPVIEISKEKLK